MRHSRVRNALISAAIAILITPTMALAQESGEAIVAAPKSPLPLEEIVKNLEERNAQRSAALEQFEGRRIYRMQYQGLPSDREAEMIVKVSYRAPDYKEFSVISESGSRVIIDHVFKKLLEGEKEAAKEENLRQTALTRQNYEFGLSGYENAPDGGRYVLTLAPRNKNKFLYRGKIWVDGKDFAVVRIEAEPGKNPSFWIKKSEIAHRYVKINDFWLPAENRTESLVRLGGKAILSIEYQDYRIIKASPPAAENMRQASSSSISTD